MRTPHIFAVDSLRGMFGVVFFDIDMVYWGEASVSNENPLINTKGKNRLTAKPLK